MNKKIFIHILLIRRRSQMKRVTAFIGSARKQATYEAVREFERNLNSYSEIEFEYVFLKDHQLE